jgi:hypothetical protein
VFEVFECLMAAYVINAPCVLRLSEV